MTRGVQPHAATEDEEGSSSDATSVLQIMDLKDPPKPHALALDAADLVNQERRSQVTKGGNGHFHSWFPSYATDNRGRSVIPVVPQYCPSMKAMRRAISS